MKIHDERNHARSAALYRMWMRAKMDHVTMVGLGLPEDVKSTQNKLARKLKKLYKQSAQG